jgi:hypothetical protein
MSACAAAASASVLLPRSSTPIAAASAPSASSTAGAFRSALLRSGAAEVRLRHSSQKKLQNCIAAGKAFAHWDRCQV